MKAKTYLMNALTEHRADLSGLKPLNFLTFSARPFVPQDELKP